MTRDIAEDITSDLTTRIIFTALADFTNQMIATYPQFGASPHAITTTDHQVWDPTTASWATRQLNLPSPQGKALLLVPVEWTRNTLLMSAGRFYETRLLTYAQFKRGRYDKDGKFHKPRKDDLKKRPEFARGRATNTKVTLQAHEENIDLIKDFKKFVAAKFDSPLPQDPAPEAAAT